MNRHLRVAFFDAVGRLGVRNLIVGDRDVRHVAVSRRRPDRRLPHAGKGLPNGVSAGLSAQSLRLDATVLAVVRRREADFQRDTSFLRKYVSGVEHY